MVEILQRGTPPAERQYTLDCRNCKSRIRCKHSETQSHTDRNETYLSIECPVCQKDITWSGK